MYGAETRARSSTANGEAVLSVVQLGLFWRSFYESRCTLQEGLFSLQLLPELFTPIQIAADPPTPDEAIYGVGVNRPNEPYPKMEGRAGAVVTLGRPGPMQIHYG